MTSMVKNFNLKICSLINCLNIAIDKNASKLPSVAQTLIFIKFKKFNQKITLKF